MEESLQSSEVKNSYICNFSFELTTRAKADDRPNYIWFLNNIYAKIEEKTKEYKFRGDMLWHAAPLIAFSRLQLAAVSENILI